MKRYKDTPRQGMDRAFRTVLKVSKEHLLKAEGKPKKVESKKPKRKKPS